MFPLNEGSSRCILIRGVPEFVMFGSACKAKVNLAEFHLCLLLLNQRLSRTIKRC